MMAPRSSMMARAVKNTFNTSQGVKVEYVDPANLIYSYTESPYFEDIYYVGEIKPVSINELKILL